MRNERCCLLFFSFSHMIFLPINDWPIGSDIRVSSGLLLALNRGNGIAVLSCQVITVTDEVLYPRWNERHFSACFEKLMTRL